jgi:hypothetical protein
MEEAIRFFRTFEVWVYVLLGLVGLFYIRKFVLSWDELRNAGFGLERDHAQSRLNSSATILVLLIFLAVGEFVLVTFIAPTMPGATPLSTPTLGLLSTATSTVSPATTQVPSDLTNAVPGSVPTVAFAPTPGGGCLPGQIELTAPKDGQEVSGVVEVMGYADITDFGFYKIEMKLPDSPNWLTIQAGNIPVKQGKLGDWDTRSLNPGEYQLGLVVVDNQARLSSPCVVQVRVISAPDTTLVP